MMSPTTSLLTPLVALRTTRHHIPQHARIPNTSIHHKPLLIYHGAFSSDIDVKQIEEHLAAVGVCKPAWRYTMYDRSHFHSTTHEVLVVSNGQARLMFGGDGNPERVDVTVGKGDAMVVPAGVAHRLIEEDGGFEMVGAYPVGAQQWDMCFGHEDERGVEERIRELRWFGRDPIYGEPGPVVVL
jgi:uncharacterized protein YjlB